MQLVPRSEQPKRLVLVRHGRTAWNQAGRAQGHADVPLDAVGLVQAKVVARHLTTFKPDMVWSSDLMRARQTAEELVALTGNKIVFDDRLREFDVGVRQGLTFEEFEAAHPEIFGRFRAGQRPQVPGAETSEEVGVRMAAVLSDAAAAVAEGETGIVVGHGASLRTGVLAFLGVPYELREMLAGMANCAWAVLEKHHERSWQIMDYNAQTLPEPLDLRDELVGQ